MKRIANKILILTLVAFAAAACDSDLKYKDYGVTSVPALLTPADDYYLELQGGSGRFATFSWEAAQTENGIAPIYEVVFYSGPTGGEVMRVDAGAKTSLEISHKNINKAAALVGIEAEEDGDVYWSVIANNGIVQAAAPTPRRLVVTRLSGFSDIPETLYLIGPGTEAYNTDLGIEMMNVTDGEFEIYTQLSGGTYNFYGSNGQTYSMSGELLMESDTPIDDERSGIYRIYVDMTTRSVSWTKINEVKYIFSGDGSYDEVMPYIGQGTWKLSEKYVEFHQEDWGRDERFRINVKIDGDETWDEEIWGGAADDPTVPDSYTSDYWNVSIRPLGSFGRYNYSWKFRSDADYSDCDITLYMTARFDDATFENYCLRVTVLD